METVQSCADLSLFILCYMLPVLDVTSQAFLHSRRPKSFAADLFNAKEMKMIVRTLILASALTLGALALPAQAETGFHYNGSRASHSVRDHHGHNLHHARGHRSEFRHHHGERHHHRHERREHHGRR